MRILTMCKNVLTIVIFAPGKHNRHRDGWKHRAKLNLPTIAPSAIRGGHTAVMEPALLLMTCLS